MATQSFSLTDQPQEITGLTDGTTYLGQSTGVGLAYVQSVTGSSAPTARTPFVVDQYAGFRVVKRAGESVWAWAAPNQTGVLVYDSET